MMEPRDNPDRERRPEGQGMPARHPEFERSERTGDQFERGEAPQRSEGGGQFRPSDTDSRPNRGQGNPNKKK